jgi:hypothetical protein
VASNLGLDIQTLDISRLQSERASSSSSIRFFAEAKQLRQWAKFDVITGASMDNIQSAFENGDPELTSRDSEGFLVTHLAAAYDRADVLRLIESKGASVYSACGSGRTVDPPKE